MAEPKARRISSEIRHQNFNALLDEFEAAEPAQAQATGTLLIRFAHYLGFKPGYVVQLRSGEKNIGPSVARKIESAAGKPEGWLDVPHPIWHPENESQEIFIEAMITYFKEMDQAARKVALQRLKEVGHIIPKNEYEWACVRRLYEILRSSKNKGRLTKTTARLLCCFSKIKADPPNPTKV